MAFKGLSEKGNELYINEREKFHAASTMKTPVMVELYRQAAIGKFNLSDTINIRNEFRSIVDGSKYSLDIGDDSGEDLYQRIGENTTIYELMYDMITVSSNLATNILIELVGANAVTSTLRGFGANDIEVLRGVEDQKAYDLGLSNSTTAYDLMIILEKIADGSASSQQDCEEMIKILKAQKFNEIIPALLPDNVTVAHKTGVITALHHDSGIVYLPDGRSYVLVLLSKNLGDFDEGTTRLAEVSRMVYDYMINK